MFSSRAGFKVLSQQRIEAIEAMSKNEVDLGHLNMPGMDGFELITQVKEREHIPIIILTTAKDMVMKG
jgi:CheY-like chemotaxis protein